jgi:hypothetical protein
LSRCDNSTRVQRVVKWLIARAASSSLRRWTRRYSSQRDESHLSSPARHFGSHPSDGNRLLTRLIGVVALVDATGLPDLVLVGDVMHIEARLKLRIELNDRAAEELPHADPRGIESADRVFSRT